MRTFPNPVTIPQTTNVPSATGGGGAVGDGIPLTQKGAANGVSDLDNEGKVPVARIRMTPETRTRLDALDVIVADPGDLTLIFDNKLI